MSTTATTTDPRGSVPAATTDRIIAWQAAAPNRKATEAERRSFAAHPANQRPSSGASAAPQTTGPGVIDVRTVRDDLPPPAVAAGADDDLLGLDQDPTLLCANLALCVVEILAGARSLDQVGRWVTDAVFVHLLRRTVLAARARAVSVQEAMRPRFRIGAPVLSSPAEGIIEAVVLVHQTTRSRAIALRLERHRTRWRATAISVL